MKAFVFTSQREYGMFNYLLTEHAKAVRIAMLKCRGEAIQEIGVPFSSQPPADRTRTEFQMIYERLAVELKALAQWAVNRNLMDTFVAPDGVTLPEQGSHGFLWGLTITPPEGGCFFGAWIMEDIDALDWTRIAMAFYIGVEAVPLSEIDED